MDNQEILEPPQSDFVEDPHVVDAFKQKWYDGQSLNDILPIRFPSTSTVHTLDCYCDGCITVIDYDDVCGQISRPRADVAVLELVGLCKTCLMMTPFELRIRGNQGLRMEWDSRERGWVGRDIRTSFRAVKNLARKLLRPFISQSPFRHAGLTEALEAIVADKDAPAAKLATDILHSGWMEALDAELHTWDIRGLDLLSSGSRAIVFEIDADTVLRIGRGAPPFRPASQNVIQTYASGMMGVLFFEILPKAEPDTLAQDELAFLTAELREEGMRLSSQDPRKIGRLEGRPIVLNPEILTEYLPETAAA